jgi:REP element-mobilizing transposase RayT
MYSEPLAYLITFTCYGTWLHGDERGSVDFEHKKYGVEFASPNQTRKTIRREQMNDSPDIFDQHERELVENTIKEVCQHRQWHLQAVNVRPNHVHVVVTGDNNPDKIMGDFKASATRKLRDSNPGYQDRKIWTEGGSMRYLWNETSVIAACEYVQNQ